MDLVLQRLHSCHLSGNWPEYSHSRRAQVQAAAAPAAAANAPITLAQRLLLQTARRSRAGQQQGTHENAQQQAQHKLQSNTLRGQQLLDVSIEDIQELVDEHQRQQQQLRQRLALGLRTASMLQEQTKQGPAHQQAQPPQASHLQPQQAEPPDQLQQRQLLQQHLALRQLLQQQLQRKRQLQLQLQSQPAVLTDLIKRSTSWQRLQQLFSSFRPLFNPIHVSCAITHLAQLQEQRLTPGQLEQAPAEFQHLVADLTAAAVACIPDFGPRQLANSLWAISRLGASKLVTNKTRNDFLTAFVDKLQYAAPQQVANMAASVANMGWSPSVQWRQLLLEAAAVRMPYFKAAELAILLHGLARLGAAPSPKWLAGFMSTCSSSMYSFSLQELSMLAVSLVRLQHTPRHSWLLLYMHAVQLQLAPAAAGMVEPRTQSVVGGVASNEQDYLQHQQHKLQTDAAEQQELLAEAVSGAWQGLQDAHANSTHDSLAHAAAAAAAAAPEHSMYEEQPQQQLAGQGSDQPPSPLEGVAAQGIVNVLWALAVWGVEPPEGWCACCLAAAEHLYSNLTMQGVSTLLWSLAKLQVQPPQPLLLLLLQHCQPLLQSAKATDFAMLAWALGTLNVTAGALTEGPEPQSVAMVTHSRGDSSSSSNGSAAHMPLTAQGAASSHHTQDGLAVPYLHTTAALGSHRGPASASSSSSNCSRHSSWGMLWLSDFVYYSYRALPAATTADVASLLVGAVRMRLSPGSTWINSVLVEAVHRLPQMSPVQLTSILLCVARMQCKPSTTFLQAYCNCSARLLNGTACAAGKHSRQSSTSPVRQATDAEGRARVDGSSTGSAGPERSRARTAAAGSAGAPARGCYTPQNLANTVGAMALLGYKPPEAWCRSFFAASAALLPSFNGRDFAYTIWALALLELQPSKRWMDAYLVQLRGQVPTMTSQQLSAVIWSLARLNHRPGVDWMNRFLDRVVALTPQHTADISSAGGGSRSSEDSEDSEHRPGSSHSTEDTSLHAPLSPLRLSGYFSAIILQGLTAWAASCLELGFDGSSGASGSALQRPPSGRRVARRARKTSLAVAGQSGAADQSKESSASGGQAAANWQAPQFSSDILSDGCIMYRFL